MYILEVKLTYKLINVLMVTDKCIMYRICISHILLLLSLAVCAQNNHHSVEGRVVESFSGDNMGGVSVELLSEDSVLLDTTTTVDIPKEVFRSGSLSLLCSWFIQFCSRQAWQVYRPCQ